MKLHFTLIFALECGWIYMVTQHALIVGAGKLREGWDFGAVMLLKDAGQEYFIPITLDK